MLKMITGRSESRTVRYPGSRFAKKLEPEFTVAEPSPSLYVHLQEDVQGSNVTVPLILISAPYDSKHGQLHDLAVLVPRGERS